MTLEEAKKEINRLADCLWSDFDKNPNKMTYGEAIAYEEVCHILDEIDTEPVGNPDKMTLTELARETRKLFEFDYVTVDAEGSITFWVRKPLYISMCGLWERNAYLDSWDIFNIDFSSAVNLDLSEYADENGEIDYSRCIVEVE